MTQLRISRTPGFRSTLALLNANQDQAAFTSHPTVPTYVEGCRRRAAQLGYGLDEFWLHDEELDGVRLNRIFQTRGIRGAVVVGLMNENRLPPRFLTTWEQFPAVVTGVRTQDPALSFACVDHHMLVVQAVEAALRLGYARPALVLDEKIDHLVNGRFTAGLLIAQQQLASRQSTRPFYKVSAARGDLAGFANWLNSEKPDVILTLYNDVRGWLNHLRLRVPQDMGLIQLEWRQDSPDWAGMNQHNDIAGEAAVDMLVGLIQNNESGLPAFPRGSLVGSTWVDGGTVSKS
jgi:LacI family transcriptional regulator